MQFPSTWAKTSATAWARFIVGFVIILNSPFWIAARFLDIAPRGWFNIEYVAIGVLSLFVRRWIWLLGLVLVLLADVIHSSAAFFFFTRQDVIRSIPYTFAIPYGRLVVYGLLILIVISCILWITLKMGPNVHPSKRVTVAIVFLGVSAIFGILDLTQGTNSVIHLRESTAYNIATAPGLALVRDIGNMVFRNRGEYDFHAVRSASQQFVWTKPELGGVESKLTSRGNAMVRPHLVLVLVESFGAFRDPKKQDWLKAVFKNPMIDSRYRTESGSVPFKGATVSAEFRELCGISAGVFDYPDEQSLSISCLPNRLKALGYDTTAIHGFTGSMFGRIDVYPKLGFSHLLFHEDLSRRREFNDCEGAFRGTCDADIARSIPRLLNEADEKKPKFIYWVTLDSHLPTRHLSFNNSVCEAAEIDADICEWAVTVRNTLAEIANSAAVPGLPPTEFILVGDHTPPFLSQRIRKQFDNGVVPFIHLVPRNSAMTNPSSTSSVHEYAQQSN